MATNKIYAVVKDGETLKELKTLAAAKKLADAEDGEVVCDGETVYIPVELTAPVEAEEKPNDTANAKKDVIPSVDTVEENMAEPVAGMDAEREPVQPASEHPKTEKYRLKALMNVRRKPSMDGQVVTTKPAGTVVEVQGIEADWLHLSDNTYILFGGGRFAEKTG